LFDGKIFLSSWHIFSIEQRKFDKKNFQKISQSKFFIKVLLSFPQYYQPITFQMSLEFLKKAEKNQDLLTAKKVRSNVF